MCNIPWEYDTLVQQLVAGGLIINTNRLAKLSFSEPYMTITMALLVRDYQRDELKTWKEINELPGFRIGVPSKELVRSAQQFLTETEIVELDSYEQFFSGNTEKLSTIAVSAEAGSAWTILYPLSPLCGCHPRIPHHQTRRHRHGTG